MSDRVDRAGFEPLSAAPVRSRTVLPGPVVVLAIALMALSMVAWWWEDHGGREWLRHVGEEYGMATRESPTWRVLGALGSGPTITFLVACAIVAVPDPRAVTRPLLALLVASLLADALKAIVMRTRPGGFDSYSWPSGHTAAVFAAAGVIARARVPWTWFTWLFAAAAATSRVLLGRHFPSDVFAGAAIGLLMAAWVTRWSILTRVPQLHEAVRLLAAAVAAALWLARSHLWHADRLFVTFVGPPLLIVAVAFALHRAMWPRGG